MNRFTGWFRGRTPSPLATPIIQPESDDEDILPITRKNSDVSKRSYILGPQTHRLPFYLMWGITLLIAAAMALINLITILSIEYGVRWKFWMMQTLIGHSGLAMGTLMLVLISMLYALVGVCLIVFVAPNCGSSGLPENRCYLNGSNVPGFFTKRTLRVRVATTILANAAGFPVGREGPTVVIGSNVAFLMSEYLAAPYVKAWIDVAAEGRSREALIVDEERFAQATRIACAVGGACGMAMIFNAPFGGFLYMFEEVTSVSWPLELTFRVFVATMICAFLSYGMLNLMGTDILEFVIYAFYPEAMGWKWQDLPLFVFVAGVMGVLTSYHTRGMLAVGTLRGKIAKKLDWYQPWGKVIETVLYCGLCALASVAASLIATCQEEGPSGLQYVQFNCEEGKYNPTASLLVSTSHSSVKLLFAGDNNGEIHYTSSFLAFVTYYALNVLLTGLPVPGGAFTATMLLGGLFGRGVGGLARELGLVNGTAAGVYAVVGSAAMLCGFKQMTLAVVLIVVECVNDLELAPVVMLSVAVSMLVNWSINEKGHDEEQIEKKDLPFLEGEAPTRLDNSTAMDLCDDIPEDAELKPVDELSAVQTALAHKQVKEFPIVDRGVCVGIVKRNDLEVALHRIGVQTPPSSFRGHKSRAFSKNPFDTVDAKRAKQVEALIARSDSGSMKELPLYKIMDPTPFIILEDMPAPRLYGLFAKAGERAACVVDRNGQFCGVISRAGLIKSARHGPHAPEQQH
mmetsp:Transcript_88303/g.175514  ORF Transcript_88303/g.175514 Transcript_88303/m.175514 type:complete len:741 (-) Transcript_88303:2-2224(-)